MSIPLADYRPQCEAFQALLEPECETRILLFHGESGCGKTTLLQSCLSGVPEWLPHVRIQLRSSVVGVPEIFSRAGDRLDWERLPRFQQQVAALQSAQTAHRVQIDRNWQVGINQHISVVLNVENVSDRSNRRQALTNAWFQDIRDFDGPLMIAFDTYEDAPTEVQDWISGPFLARVEGIPQMRVLVAGQKVPDWHTIEWGHCCAQYELLGVPEAADWWPVVEAMKRRIDVPDPNSWLAGVCHALRGRPNEIMQVIEGLPRREGEG